MNQRNFFRKLLNGVLALAITATLSFGANLTNANDQGSPGKNVSAQIVETNADIGAYVDLNVANSANYLATNPANHNLGLQITNPNSITGAAPNNLVNNAVNSNPDAVVNISPHAIAPNNLHAYISGNTIDAGQPAYSLAPNNNANHANSGAAFNFDTGQSAAHNHQANLNIASQPASHATQ